MSNVADNWFGLGPDTKIGGALKNITENTTDKWIKPEDKDGLETALTALAVPYAAGFLGPALGITSSAGMHLLSAGLGGVGAWANHANPLMGAIGGYMGATSSPGGGATGTGSAAGGAAAASKPWWDVGLNGGFSQAVPNATSALSGAASSVLPSVAGAAASAGGGVMGSIAGALKGLDLTKLLPMIASSGLLSGGSKSASVPSATGDSYTSILNNLNASNDADYARRTKDALANYRVSMYGRGMEKSGMAASGEAQLLGDFEAAHSAADQANALNVAEYEAKYQTLAQQKADAESQANQASREKVMTAILQMWGPQALQAFGFNVGAPAAVAGRA